MFLHAFVFDDFYSIALNAGVPYALNRVSRVSILAVIGPFFKR